MIKKFYQQILVIILLFQSLISIGQSNNLGLKGYQKTLKFENPISLEKAKEKFIKEFNLDDKTTFVEIQTNTDKKGFNHRKFQQYYNGVKVEYGTMIIHIKDGYVTSINGELYNPLKLDLTSNISSSLALQKAISHVAAKQYLWNNTKLSSKNQYKKPKGELVIFPIIEDGKYTLKLAFKFDIYASVPLSRGYVYINANNGNYLFTEPIIKHYYNNTEDNSKGSSKYFKKSVSSSKGLLSGNADTRYSGNRTIETRAEINGTYTLNDDIRNVHTYNAQNSPTDGTYQFTKVDFVDNDNVWSSAEYDNAARDNAALDAHWGAMEVSDFWALLGRNSIDDAGMEIRSYVHVGTDYFNAYWNGSVMSYGDGSPDPLTAVDIIGHEMAHGVTTWTANLAYAKESGAMNEGFSDIFGSAVEFYAKGTGTDINPNSETWLMGEDFWPGGFLRSLSDPKSKGNPDTYNGTNYIDTSSSCSPSSTNDYCGVHNNSTVLSHWFYILSTGQAGTNDVGDVFDVTGIGITKAQEIAYLTLRDYLTPNSTFMDARNSAVDVASSLYGSNSAERKATQDAFYAVNIGDKFIPYATDLNLIKFSQLDNISCGGTIIPKILVRNSGATNTINSIQINYSIDGVAQTPYNWSGTLAINGETEITLPTINKIDIRKYELIVEGIVTGDGDSTNNKLIGTFSVNKTNDMHSGVYNFNNLLESWLTFNEVGNGKLWSIGTPNKANLNAVSSGSKAYVTLETENYPNNTKAYLISPCYDLTKFSNPEMRFDMAFELQKNFDILYVEYSTDATNWDLLGSSSDPNWYNSNRIFESGEISNDCQNCRGGQWTGSSSVLTQYSYDLNSFKNEPNIIFRFVFHSDESITDEGVVIDDFVIGEKGVFDDDDNDGVQNSDDSCPNTPTGEIVDANGCSDSQLDDDNDGVSDADDLCPNTTAGATVDATGCFMLPQNNFNIQITGETCPDKNNGQINITTTEAHDYVATINGTDYQFTNTLTVDNLAPDTYNVCVTVPTENYEQCFVVEVIAGTTVSGKSTVKSNRATVEIEQGTAPYKVIVNGKDVLDTYAPVFTINVKHGDLLEVKTAKTCEGVYSKAISLLNNFEVYPNPSTGIFEISIPTVNKQVTISLYNIQSQLISQRSYPVNYGKVNLDISNQPAGIYFAKMQMDKPVTLKIIKL